MNHVLVVMYKECAPVVTLQHPQGQVAQLVSLSVEAVPVSRLNGSVMERKTVRRVMMKRAVRLEVGHHFMLALCLVALATPTTM